MKKHLYLLQISQLLKENNLLYKGIVSSKVANSKKISEICPASLVYMVKVV